MYIIHKYNEEIKYNIFAFIFQVFSLICLLCFVNFNSIRAKMSQKCKKSPIIKLELVFFNLTNIF